MKLAIAIPTYNRHESIQRRLDDVKNTCPMGTEIWIADNSTNNLTQAIATSYSSIRVKYIKNRYNLGGGANFLQSLLIGDSDFVWLRGDDDPITEAQIRAVLRGIDFDPDIIILSQSAQNIEEIRSLRRFFSFFNITQSSGWMSMLVFKQSSLSYGLKWGYWGIRSGWAHVALVLGILRDCSSPCCLVVPTVIAASDFREGGRDARKWSFIKTCVDNFPLIFDMVPNKSIQKHAFYHWRKTQDFKLITLYTRARLGLAPHEKLTLKTFLHLLSLLNPRSTVVAIILLALRFTPRFLLTSTFVMLSFGISESSLRALELEDLLGLGFAQRFAIIRAMQVAPVESQGFL